MVSFPTKVTNCQAKSFHWSCRLPIGQESRDMDLTKDFAAAHTGRFNKKHENDSSPAEKNHECFESF